MTSIGVNRLLLIDLLHWPCNLRRSQDVHFLKRQAFSFRWMNIFLLWFFSSYRAYWDWNGINKPLKVRWYYNFDVFYSQARRNRNKQNYLGMLFEIINHFDRIICLCALILIIAAHEWMFWMFISFKPFQWYMWWDTKNRYIYKCTNARNEQAWPIVCKSMAIKRISNFTCILF